MYNRNVCRCQKSKRKNELRIRGGKSIFAGYHAFFCTFFSPFHRWVFRIWLVEKFILVPRSRKTSDFFLLFWLPYSPGGCDIFPSMHHRFTFFLVQFPLPHDPIRLNENSIHSLSWRCRLRVRFFVGWLGQFVFLYKQYCFYIVLDDATSKW